MECNIHDYVRGHIPCQGAPCGPHGAMSTHVSHVSPFAMRTSACMQGGRTALMDAAFKGESECLSALMQAKADINVQSTVRWSEVVVSVPGCNIDYLVLDSRLAQRRHYDSRI